MNRRRTSAAAKKRPAKKRPAKKRAQTGIRKKPTRKTTTKRAASTRPAKKKTSPSKVARSKSQNRRRPAPKKAAPKQRRDWRGFVTGLPSRARQWAEGKHGHFRRLGQALAVAAALGAVWWVGQQTVRYARTADAFSIREVVVEGNTRLEEIDVRRAAGLQIGSNAFEVSMEDARDRLLQHPWVKDATVVRKLPNRVRVDLVERTPVALVALDQLYLVSEEGAVFKRIGVDDPADYPVITGIASERFYDDFDYRKAVLLRSMAVLQDYEGAGLAEREPVSEIHFEGMTGVELYVGDDGMHVRLGRGQHRQKLRRLKQVLTRLSREKARPAYVYLDNVRSPERVTVRLQ